MATDRQRIGAESGVQRRGRSALGLTVLLMLGLLPSAADAGQALGQLSLRLVIVETVDLQRDARGRPCLRPSQGTFQVESGQLPMRPIGQCSRDIRATRETRVTAASGVQTLIVTPI